MSNQFLKLRRSAVPGKIPDTGSLDLGEIALNTYDGLAFMKKSGSNGEQIIIIGNTTGSFTGSFTGEFTGSLLGTASYAITSSNVEGGAASYIALWGTDTRLSSSYLNQTGSVVKGIYQGITKGIDLDFGLGSYILGNAGTGNSTHLQVFDTAGIINVYTPNYTYFDQKVGISIVPTNPGLAISGSLEVTGPGTSKFINTNVQITGSLNVTDTITAQRLVVQTISSSVIYSSGSNIFGDELSDRQQFTGSVTVTGSLSLNDDPVVTQTPYNTFSQSIQLRATKLEATASVLTIASASFALVSSSYAAASSSLSIRTTNLETTASVLTAASASFAVMSGSLSTRVTTLENASASFAQQSGSNSIRLTNLESTASILTTASASFSSSITYLSSSFIAFSQSYTTASFTGSFTGIASLSGSFSGSFFGNGGGLTNISASSVVGLNLSLISSGSVTASTDPIYGFRVNSNTQISGSTQITGSLGVTGSFNISGSVGSIFNANVDTMIFTGSIYQSGSTYITGSLGVFGGITGSLYGTSSWAVSASHAPTALTSSNALTASYALTASTADNFYVRQDITASNALIYGSLTAQTIYAQYITASTELITGSTKFGTQLTDTHQFTGSVTITGSLSLNNDPVVTQTPYNTFSQSIQLRATNLESTASVLTAASASFAVMSGSLSTRVTTLENASASFAQQSGSNSIRLTNLETTASVLTTASASFAIVSSSYASASGSLSIRTTNLESTASVLTTASASFAIVSSSFASTSGSLSTRTTNLESTASILTTASASFAIVSASYASASGSLSIRTTNLETTASVLTTASASFALVSSSYSSASGSLSIRTTNLESTASILVQASASFSSSITYLSSSFTAFSQSYMTGSFTGSFTGYLYGTASWAVSASHAPTALTSSNAVSASYAITSSYTFNAATASTADNFVVRQDITASNALIYGTLIAQTIHAQYVTASTEFITGSTKFGTQLTNTHQFTGSVTITGSLSLNGDPVVTQTPYNTFSQSIQLRATNLESTASVLTSASASFAQQSGSNSIRLTNLESTASVLTTASASFATVSSSYASASGSLSTRVTTLENASASFAQQSGSNSIRFTNLESTASVLTTASASFALVSASYSQFSQSYMTGSFTGSFTGFLFGTSSWALNAVTSSHSLTAVSASYAVTSSHAIRAVSASYAVTSSYAENITVSGSITNVDYIDFDTTVAFTNVAGRLGWDSGEHTLQLGLDGGNVQYSLGEQMYQWVYNAETSSMIKGNVVFISGSQGNQIAVKFASALAEYGSANTLGFVAETITAGGSGWVITEGNLRKLDTSALSAGLPIYLSTSLGQYTQTKPTAPNHTVTLGFVERVNATVGSIYVKIDNGYELGELHNVIDNTTTSSYGDLLVKSGSVWTNSKQLTGSYGLTGSLSATSITASLFGTASWAQQAVTASYVLQAVSSSFATSASFATTASYSVSSSFVTGAIFTNNNLATSASFAVTASYAINAGAGAGFPFSGSAVITGSLLVSQSFVDFTKATYVSGAFTGSLFGTSSWAISASYATFALSASNAPGYTVNFSQSVPATTWSFVHNLNTRNPIVQVYDTNYNQLLPNAIIGVDLATVEVRFDYSQAGYAVASNGGGLYVTGSTSRIVQTVAATTWSFTHNLNTKYPAFEVYNTNDDVIIPAGIHVINTDSAEIYFAVPTAGTAIANFSGINGLQDNAVSASYAATASYADSFTINKSFINYNEVASSVVGSNTVFNQATGSYTSVFINYTVASGSNARSGQISAVWNGASAQYTDNSTLDIGSTTGVTGSVALSGANAQFNVQTSTQGWKIKSLSTFM